MIPRLTFRDYQNRANETAIYPNVGTEILHPVTAGLVYPVMAIGGEVGELQNKVKKLIRDGDNAFTHEQMESLVKEIGDIQWYLAAICTELGIDLGRVAIENIQKLERRKAEGKLQGSGDDR